MAITSDFIFSGKNLMGYVNTGTTETPTWKRIMCQTSASISTSTNSETFESKCGSKSLPGTSTYEAQLEGALERENTDTESVDMFEWWDKIKDGAEAEFRFAPVDITATSNGLPVITFTGSVTSYDEQYPNETATFSATIGISGGITKTPYTAE